MSGPTFVIKENRETKVEPSKEVKLERDGKEIRVTVNGFAICKLVDNDKEWGRLMAQLSFTKIESEEWVRVRHDIDEVNRARNQILADLKKEGA